eukprot:879312-Pleurochrysis_carterae.AAC.2
MGPNQVQLNSKRLAHSCNCSPTLYTFDSSERKPYSDFVTKASWRYARQYPLKKQSSLLSVLNARLLFRHPHYGYLGGENIVWNSSDAHYSVVNTSRLEYRRWLDPNARERKMQCPGPSLGLAYAFSSWFVGNFGHFLHDHLPIIAWLREVMPTEATLVIVKHELHEQIMQTVDASFSAKRIRWLKYNTLLCTGEARLLGTIGPPWNDQELSRRLRSWIRPDLPIAQMPTSEPEALVIYYSRLQTPTIRHGRFMVPEHEEAVLALIRSKMNSALKGVRTRLEIYNGHRRDGSSMPIAEQAALFKSASYVIGPHGSGMANVVWLPNAKPHLRPQLQTANTRASGLMQSCQQRPGVLEFTCGMRSLSVQTQCPFGKTYWFFFAVVFWAEYHHILFAPNSSSLATWVRMDELALALDHLFR